MNLSFLCCSQFGPSNSKDNSTSPTLSPLPKSTETPLKRRRSKKTSDLARKETPKVEVVDSSVKRDYWKGPPEPLRGEAVIIPSPKLQHREIQGADVCITCMYKSGPS